MDNSTKTKSEKWDWAKHKPNNVLKVRASSDIEFFKWWCTLIHPFVQLTPRETDVISAFLKQRMDLAQQVPEDLVDTLLMSNDSKNKVIRDCKITLSHFYVIMSALKKKNVVSEKGINPRLVPNIRREDHGNFQLLIMIDNSEGK